MVSRVIVASTDIRGFKEAPRASIGSNWHGFEFGWECGSRGTQWIREICSFSKLGNIEFRVNYSVRIIPGYLERYRRAVVGRCDDLGVYTTNMRSENPVQLCGVIFSGGCNIF